MATKRCFTPKIVESDAFLDMPLSAQCLYFHLNFSADDDGFVNSPRKVMKMIGSSEDDLKLLKAKSFVLTFESGVIVIKHYRMHNTLQNDRYKPTDYQEEFRLLGLKNNKSYTWKQNVSILETQHNITQHNITKHCSRYLEAGYPQETIDATNNIINSINLKELDANIYAFVVNVVENDAISSKQEYVYVTAKKKGWLIEDEI